MPQNDPSLQAAALASDITKFLEEGKVSEAASHAIAALSADVDEKVGVGLFVLLKYRIFTSKSGTPCAMPFRSKDHRTVTTGSVLNTF